jgi:hypothetical protein
MARRYNSGAVTVRSNTTAVDRREVCNANKGLKTMITQASITSRGKPSANGQLGRGEVVMVV